MENAGATRAGKAEEEALLKQSQEGQGDPHTEKCEKAVRDMGVGGMFGSFL